MRLLISHPGHHPITRPLVDAAGTALFDALALLLALAVAVIAFAS